MLAHATAAPESFNHVSEVEHGGPSAFANQHGARVQHDDALASAERKLRHPTLPRHASDSRMASASPSRQFG